jgi:hypothetical protein
VWSVLAVDKHVAAAGRSDGAENALSRDDECRRVGDRRENVDRYQCGEDHCGGKSEARCGTSHGHRVPA